MGGLCFIFGTALAFAAATLSHNICPTIHIAAVDFGCASFALAGACLCGLLGLADDYSKVTSKSNAGISAKLRLACEFELGLALGLTFTFLHPPDIVLCMSHGGEGLARSIHLNEYPVINLLYMFLLVPFVMAATSNALNLHDGMDGLAAGTSVIVFVTLAIMLVSIPGCTALSCLAAAAAGAIFAFLLYNRYPARVFMGDTGSLFIGALMAGIVVYGGLVLWFVPMALIYIVETLSVISQVLYFKATKAYTADKPMSKPACLLFKLTHKLPGAGKRLWRMAPIHHHFEALAAENGQKEWVVVLWFWLAQMVLCAICLAGFSFVFF